MRIAFILVGNNKKARCGVLTGENIRYNGASSSGTDSSVIYVAEYLKKNGHEVTIALEEYDTPTISNGVFYTNLNFEGDDIKEYDVLISCLWFDNFKDLPIKVTNSLIYWYHLAWGYSYQEISNYVIENNLNLGLVSVSNWARGHNQEFNEIFKSLLIDVKDKKILEVNIPNPVATDIIDEVLSNPPKRIPHRIVHHGQWSRGCSTAEKASQELNWPDLDFQSFDYLNTQNGKDKKTLFNILASSEYFIFPQITHDKFVYKDTFSVSTAEAIGLGVITVSYPLGALPEYFGDYCQFLDFPEGVDLEKMKNERLSEEPKLTCTDNIVKKIEFLENNKKLKNNIRKKGIKYIRNTFNIERIGAMWIEFLNDLNK
jgi:hypothetical protein